MQTHAVSPFIPPIDQDNAAIVGERTYIWKNVNFFESGRYNSYSNLMTGQLSLLMETKLQNQDLL